MLRLMLFLLASLLISIPRTSIQDISIPIENHPHRLFKRATSGNSLDSIDNLLQWLTEQQYQYETAYYALALKNVFPKFAKFLHEQGEQKYDDVKNVIRLCQVLNYNVDLQYISSHQASRPLRFLAPEAMNQTNFAQFFADLKTDECKMTFRKLDDLYQSTTNISVPLQMYLEKQFYPKQVSRCKSASDLYIQIDRFVDVTSNERFIPFSLMFLDSRVQLQI